MKSYFVKGRRVNLKWLLHTLTFILCCGFSGQIRYSIPEEMRKGLFVGDVAKDLGLDVRRLVSGRARLAVDDDNKYVALNNNKGHIVVNERIDREMLCAKKSPCSFGLEIVLEDPLELFSITIEIQDVNDHAPAFPKKEIHLEISESTPTGTVFLLDSALDPDVGINSLQSYSLKSNEHFILKQNTRSDDVTPCSFTFEILLEKPMELHPVTIEVLDVNDNAPTFQNSDLDFEISESAALGSRFVLESADDADVGQNGLHSYILTPNDNFILKQHVNPDGSKYAEMVLQKPLDREEQSRLSLKLLAVDGGNPQKSGTVNIDVNILDANDNAPVFNQSVYKTAVIENAPKGTHVITVNASDIDSGSHGQVTYSFSKSKAGIADMFGIDSVTGRIYVTSEIDFEKDKKIEFYVEAKDQGGMTDSSKIEIDIIDVNDNAPVINVMSFTSPLSEDSPAGTTIGIINVKDLDSGENGKLRCTIEKNVPFKIKFNVRNYYALITDATLDRETLSEFNITVIASDAGSPPLLTKKTLNLKVSDVNDNAPVFSYNHYSGFIVENNSPGVSIFNVNAKDPDENQNARVSYILEQGEIGGSPIFEYVSVNAEDGVISAVRSFDYEQIKELIFVVKAQDGGSPPLSSNVTVKILIQDQNDNPPQVLYPVQTGGSVVAEMVPRSADVGYLVTKVVAVDVDSGQNAWLSYKLQKATDRALFEVGLQNGEIRTIRQVNDKDAIKQRLTVIVEDNGQPSRSATVIVNVAVADSFPEVLSEFTDLIHDKEYNDNLTFYLVLALAVVSFLFITCVVVIISVKIYRWRQSRILYQSNLPVIPYYPPRYSDTLGTGTLQHVYNYEVCRTTDSRKSDCKFGRAGSQNVLIMDPSSTGTMQRIQSEKTPWRAHHSIFPTRAVGLAASPLTDVKYLTHCLCFTVLTLRDAVGQENRFCVVSSFCSPVT
uniref:Cadherin domain-containing protein n=1 Tax=Salarias fasciatus TaxID=181472 RepID=A0A672FX69_SALFA